MAFGLTCPFGTSQTLTAGSAPAENGLVESSKLVVKSCVLGNKARMSMKTKERASECGNGVAALEG